MDTTATVDQFYKKPFLSTASFAVAVLLFFLPFFNIKCNETTVKSLSGKDLVFGTSGQLDTGNDLLKQERQAESAGDKSESFIVAILAMVLGVAGAAISFISKGRYTKAIIGLGVAGALLLIILWVQLSSRVSDEANFQSGADMQGLDGMMSISVQITFWFILSVLSFLAAAWFAYKQQQLISAGEVPPAGAPQTPIHNPGDQSFFPPAPSGEKDLG